MRRPHFHPLLAVLLALAACSEPATSGRDAGSFRWDAAAAEPLDASAGPDAAEPDGGGTDSGVHSVVIKSVLPGRGPLAGGTSVTIEGAGFYQGFAEGATAAKKDTRVYFGANEVADLDIIDDSTMEVLSPPNPAGASDVRVVNPNGTATCSGCFTYSLDLSFSSLSPERGPLAGGLTITLKGDAFTDDLTVLVGGKACPTVTLVDAQTATAIVPPGDAAGPVDVRVFNKNGIAEIRRGFTYFEPLRLTGADPAFGPLAGGGTVTLSGSQLGGASRVLFGTAEASFTVVDDQTLTAIAPAAASAGAVDLVVETASGTATRADGYVYFDPSAIALSIAGVYPSHGPAAGGNTVTVVGSGFSGDVAFEIGGVAAMLVGTPEANLATLVVPAGAANRWVDVSASGSLGTADLGLGYHYNVALTAIAPASGPAAGGEAVTLSGAGFADGLEVLFGALPATAVSRTDEATLAATTPAGSGATDVRVRDPADPDNEAVLAGGYTFVEPLLLGRVSPDTGAIAGGTYVTVLGTGFGPGLSVTFGGTPLKDQRVVDAHTVVGHTPPGKSGAVDVAVSLGTQQDVSEDAFSYFDPTSGGGGSSGGPLDGTLNVTVLDSGYLRYGQPLPGATVMLGSDPTTPFQGKTDRLGQITFSDPQLVKAQMVTVFKEGYQALTVAAQESQNLTVFLGSNSSSESTYPPDMSSGSNSSSSWSYISGRVTGFKLPRALSSHETAWAEVWVVSTSVYSTPPFGSRPSADQRALRGERWKLETDGDNYTVVASAGLRAVYAVYGIYDSQTAVYTPVLLGVLRGVNADPTRPAIGKDIVLDTHLDASVPVHLEQPPTSAETGAMVPTSVYAWLELGAEGVIPLGSVSAETPDATLGSMPEVDGADLLFFAYAYASGPAPASDQGVTSSADSYLFRKQQGDLSQGLTIGPMLGLAGLVQPSVNFTGVVSWSLPGQPDADLAKLSLARSSKTTGSATVWSVIMPGSQRSISLPQNLYQQLVATGSADDTILVSMSFSRAARFDWAHWSYSSLSADAWTAWAGLDATAPLFAPEPEP